MEPREDGWTKWTSNCLVPLAIFYFSPRYIGLYMLGYMGPFLTRIRDAGVQKGAPFDRNSLICCYIRTGLYPPIERKEVK